MQKTSKPQMVRKNWHYRIGYDRIISARFAAMVAGKVMQSSWRRGFLMIQRRGRSSCSTLFNRYVIFNPSCHEFRTSNRTCQPTTFSQIPTTEGSGRARQNNPAATAGGSHTKRLASFEVDVQSMRSAERKTDQCVSYSA